MKKITIISATCAVVFLGVFWYFLDKKYKEDKYIVDSTFVVDYMTASSKTTEIIVDHYSRIWHDAIFKEGFYFTDEYRGKDFNEALEVAQTKFSESIQHVESTRSEIEGKIRLLSNPPDKYKELHGEIKNMYADYLELTTMAISPQGSLQSFNEQKKEVASRLIKSLGRINILLPSE